MVVACQCELDTSTHTSTRYEIVKVCFIIALIKFRFEPSPVSIKETCEESEWGAKITRVSETHLSQEAKPTSDTSSKDIFQSALNRYIVDYNYNVM